MIKTIATDIRSYDKVLDLLAEIGAKRLRKNKSLVWLLPNGKRFTMSITPHDNVFAPRKMVADIKRSLGRAYFAKKAPSPNPKHKTKPRKTAPKPVLVTTTHVESFQEKLGTALKAVYTPPPPPTLNEKKRRPMKKHEDQNGICRSATPELLAKANEVGREHGLEAAAKFLGEHRTDLVYTPQLQKEKKMQQQKAVTVVTQSNPAERMYNSATSRNRELEQEIIALKQSIAMANAQIDSKEVARIKLQEFTTAYEAAMAEMKNVEALLPVAVVEMPAPALMRPKHGRPTNAENERIWKVISDAFNTMPSKGMGAPEIAAYVRKHMHEGQVYDLDTAKIANRLNNEVERKDSRVFRLGRGEYQLEANRNHHEHQALSAAV